MKYFLIVLALLFAFSGCATVPQTTAVKKNTPDGKMIPVQDVKSDIDPYEVSNKWTHIDTASMGGYPLLFFLNPDVTEEIQYVAMMFYYDLVLAYTYIYEGGVHLFVIDWETGKYQKHNCDQENWLNTFDQFTKNNRNSI